MNIKTPETVRGRVNGFALCWLTPPALTQALFFAAPLLFLFALTFWSVHSFRLQPDFTFANWTKIYGQPYFWSALANTLLYAASGALLASVVAFPASWHIAFRLSPRARRLALAALMTPFFTSYLVRIYAWQGYLSDSGIINSALAHFGFAPVKILNSAAGTFVGYLTLCLPLTVLLQTFGLARVDRNLLDASYNLGCGPLRAVFAVVIPAARAGLTLAALFAFILIFGDFASPVYLGGAASQTLSILITDLAKAGQQWPRAAVVAATMICILLASAFAALRFAYRRPA